MEPVTFEHSNKTLVPGEYSDDIVGALPIWTDGEQCVSCWKMSLGDRLRALLFGRVWLAVLSGKAQPPVSVVVAREYLK